MRPRKLRTSEEHTLRQCCGGTIPPATLELAERIAGRVDASHAGDQLTRGHLAIIAEIGEWVTPGDAGEEAPAEPSAPAGRRGRRQPEPATV